jgi:hypothetical protein
VFKTQFIGPCDDMGRKSETDVQVILDDKDPAVDQSSE